MTAWKMLADWTMAELEESLKAERAQMVSCGQQAEACRGKARRQAIADHDQAEMNCLLILSEMRRREV